MGGKEDVNKLWPIQGDKVQVKEKVVWTEEMKQKIMQAHNIKL